MSTPVLFGSPNPIGGKSQVELTNGQIAVLSTGSSVQIYNEDGSTAGSPISIPGGLQITALPNGGFFLVYQVEPAGGTNPYPDNELVGTAYNADGSVATAPFVIAAPSNSVFDQTLTTLANGQVAVAYRTYNSPVEDFLQVINTDGTSAAGPQTLSLPSNTSTAPNIAGLTGGNIAMATWNDVSPSYGAISVLVEQSNLTPVSSVALRTGVSGQTVGIPNITALSDGGFAVTYQVYTLSGSVFSSSDYVDVFNSDGTQRGTETTLVTDVENGSSGSSLDNQPLIAGLADGKFVAVWESIDAASTGSTEIYAQLFNADGSENSTAALVKSWLNSSGNYGSPMAVTAELGGRFLVTYEDRNGNPFSQTLTIPTVKNDFNGDGLGDLIWQNGTIFTEWQSSGNSFTPNVDVGSVGAGWTLAGTGDFNGDGKADLIWQNGTTFTEWQSTGNSFTPNVDVGSVGAGWTLAGVGDFNGDGKADLIWQNGTTFAEWQSTGNAFTQNVDVGSVGAGWSIAAVGDFNGDGKADLIWQNGTTFTEWQSTGNGFTQNVDVGSVGAGWNIVGTGDFNGDGKTDLIWENGGAFSEWQSTGNGFTQNAYVGSLGSGWSVAAIGDFNGDGMSDILFRNTNGTFTEWQSTGNSFTQNVLVNSSVGTAWSLEYSPAKTSA